jgi:ParB family chromosome partitioning protein
MKTDIQNTQTILEELTPIVGKSDDTKVKKEKDTPLPISEKLDPVKNEIPISENDKVEMLPVTALVAFKSHPFKITENEDFFKLMDSIKENGIIIPAIARRKGKGYELIAGHRRKAVCEKLGIDKMPVIVRDMTDEQSTIYMVDSNVQRENILPSEKAFAYKMKMDALKRQGQRNDLASSPLATMSKGTRTADIIGGQYGDGKDTVHRYIRLTELNPQLLQMVDDGKIAFRPAAELSYLTKAQQKLLLSAMEAEQSTPSLSQAQKLKLHSLEGLLDETKISSFMREQKPNQCESIKIPCDKVRELLKKDMTIKQIEEFIFNAIADYQRKLQQQRSGTAR